MPSATRSPRPTATATRRSTPTPRCRRPAISILLPGGLLLTTTDPDGNETENVYYTSGASNGLVHTTTVAYGTLLAMTTTFNYDSNGNPSSTITPVGTTSYVYDNLNLLVSRNRPAANHRRLRSEDHLHLRRARQSALRDRSVVKQNLADLQRHERSGQLDRRRRQHHVLHLRRRRQPANDQRPQGKHHHRLLQQSR